jgi:hypothetical protein
MGRAVLDIVVHHCCTKGFDGCVVALNLDVFRQLHSRWHGGAITSAPGLPHGRQGSLVRKFDGAVGGCNVKVVGKRGPTMGLSKANKPLMNACLMQLAPQVVVIDP